MNFAKLLFFWSLICLFALLSSTSVVSQSLSAKEIVSKADDKARGQSSYAEMTMTIERPGWTRSVSLKSWSKGHLYALVYISAPAREKGQVFLKRDKDMWNWVPSIERLIKIPPSMMMQSWMGSDFTNDDLVKESSIVKDYDHKIMGQEQIRGKQCYKIELTPLPDAAVTWGKIIFWITVDGFVQWEIEYYDEDLELVNRLRAFDIKKMDDRFLPGRMEMEPVNKPGQKTILETHTMVFNQDIDDHFFSQQNMKVVK